MKKKELGSYKYELECYMADNFFIYRPSSQQLTVCQWIFADINNDIVIHIILCDSHP